MSQFLLDDDDNSDNAKAVAIPPGFLKKTAEHV